MLTRTLVVVAIVLLQQVASDRVVVTTPDEAKLGARFFDAGPKSPGVLFFPMCSAGAEGGWAPVAERLRTAGISSLIVTYRNRSGNAGGSATGDQRGPDADAALAYLRSRIGPDAPVAFGGSSCGVHIALRTAAAHATKARAVVVVSGPHSPAQLDYVRSTPSLAVFSAASAKEPPSPEWARALEEASPNPASRVAIVEERGHGTDLFGIHPTLASDIADWLIARLEG
jgi:predicted alpha/beta hydrolase